MKNLKKVIILLIIMIIVVIFLICNQKENTEEIVVEDIYTEVEEETKEINKIILHITGEVNTPRNY